MNEYINIIITMPFTEDVEVDRLYAKWLEEFADKAEEILEPLVLRLNEKYNLPFVVEVE